MTSSGKEAGSLVVVSCDVVSVWSRTADEGGVGGDDGGSGAVSGGEVDGGGGGGWVSGSTKLVEGVGGALDIVWDDVVALSFLER